MAYKITRFEVYTNEIFVNIEINDENGFYNYGRWLPADEEQAIKNEMQEKGKSAEQYMLLEKSQLKTWAESRLEEAKAQKMIELKNEDVLDILAE